MKILGTGLNGLVGSRIVELLQHKYKFQSLSRSSGVDIANKEQVRKAIVDSDAEAILHLAAKTNVDSCELDKPLGQGGEAWKINVEGTRNVALACQETNKKLIYISTDFVFDGKNPPNGGYSEISDPNPINWYATTKMEGEKIVQKLKMPWIIIRIAFPYRAKFVRADFFRAILNRLKQGLTIAAVDDQIFMPTFIDDIALAIDSIGSSGLDGIFHVHGSQKLTPFDAANLIAEKFGFRRSLITKISGLEFFKDRADRPFQLILKSDRIDKLGVKMRTFEQGLEEIIRQIKNI